jgi:hypothetical protein
MELLLDRLPSSFPKRLWKGRRQKSRSGRAEHSGYGRQRLLLGAAADLFLQKFLARWTQNNQHSPLDFHGSRAAFSGQLFPCMPYSCTSGGFYRPNASIAL